MKLRGSVRLRLTVLFGALFLAAGAGLLAITYSLVSHATDVATAHGSAFFLSPSGEQFIGRTGSLQTGGAVPSGLQQVTEQLNAQASEERSAEQGALLLYSGIGLGIMGVLSVALGWFAAGRSLRPLRRITAAARRISATNLQERLSLYGPDDDLRELADTIDGLFGRLAASFDAQRQFVANASHELRTPLARSRTLLEVALRDPDCTLDSLRATCGRVLTAGEQQERMIEALLTLARSQRGIAVRRTVDLAAVAHDVLGARGTEIAARGLTMDVTLAPAPMAGDLPLAERAVANLVDNALRHNTAEGSVRLWAGTTDDGRAIVRVENSGPELDDADIPRLLQPFQRLGGARTASRAPAASPASWEGGGLGLGLSIVQAIAAAHGATLTATARPGGGLIATLAFPLRPAMMASAEPVLVG